MAGGQRGRDEHAFRTQLCFLGFASMFVAVLVFCAVAIPGLVIITSNPECSPNIDCTLNLTTIQSRTQAQLCNSTGCNLCYDIEAEVCLLPKAPFQTYGWGMVSGGVASAILCSLSALISFWNAECSNREQDTFLEGSRNDTDNDNDTPTVTHVHVTRVMEMRQMEKR